MPRVTFNQLVKHGLNIYNEGDSVTVTDEEAEYFGQNGWLDGVPAVKDPIQINVDLPSSGGIESGPAYINDAPLNIELDVHDGVISSEDSNG